ncbi:hypothetical protein DY000_02005849 [Brassica cretica]|uniref:PB1 domain-containing protein n=1 Tax=Brassica cretica TaxID=69181 RepID=A0ABQ7BRC7_BRACR|nr:hypothetical protein DY000_02005849 [Brassica cretica]
MEKFSYNSYPDSTDSSPRSREIDFDNPPPWDDQNHQQQTQSYKVKFMCSYNGKIQPRPHDNQLTYVNGETKILSVDRGIRFPVLASKLSAVCGEGGGDVLFKYQLPGEDLDALISVANDDDLEHMMHEYDRLLRVSSKPARMRLFLFPSASSGGFGSEGSTQSDRDRFVEALNTVRSRPESEKSVTAPPSNADFLFGSEKVVSSPPPQPPHEVKLPVPVALEPPLFNDPRVIQQEGQVNQGGYYPYREQHQPAYSMTQPPVGVAKGQPQQQQQQQQAPLPFTSGPPPPQSQYSAVPPPQQVVGLADTRGYTQVTYAGGMGKQVYYTDAPPPGPPQYHGIGLPVTGGMSELRTGPDGKLVAMNMAPKVSSQNSDSAV